MHNKKRGQIVETGAKVKFKRFLKSDGMESRERGALAVTARSGDEGKFSGGCLSHE